MTGKGSARQEEWAGLRNHVRKLGGLLLPRGDVGFTWRGCVRRRFLNRRDFLQFFTRRQEAL